MIIFDFVRFAFNEKIAEKMKTFIEKKNQRLL